jgi:hypothetical protein
VKNCCSLYTGQICINNRFFFEYLLKWRYVTVISYDISFVCNIVLLPKSKKDKTAV